LIENALKYARDPEILITTRSASSGIFLSVEDNGKGIEKKYWNKIFKKFYRVPNGEEVSERGFGLGLAFVKRIVQAHRGKITVKSTPGVGSEFQIFLPVN
jgi:two-component system phosphate regulon sensor histidine kinase PhoR